MEKAEVRRPLRVGWNLPGTFSRLGLHTGMILAWLRYGLPLPSLVVATSVGAIISACCISFDQRVLERVKHTVINLKREQMYVISKGLIRTGLHLLVAGGVVITAAVSAGSLGLRWALLLLSASALYALARVRGTRGQFIWSVGILMATVAAAGHSSAWSGAIVFGIGVGVFDLLVRRAVQIFFHESDSPLDNTPLRELLLALEVPQLSFRAATELRILATDVAAPGIIVYSNHEPRLCDPENQQHCERFVDGILGSSALPGRFPLRVVDGKTPRDGEVWTDSPIRQFRGEVDIVFRFDYWKPLLPGQAPRHWLADLFRSFDVLRDKNTRDKMATYERECEQDPVLPKVVNIRASEKVLRRIPELAIYDFKPGQLRRSVVIGYKIIRENLRLIRSELGLSGPGDPARL